MHNEKVTISEEMTDCQDCLEFIFEKYGWDFNCPENMQFEEFKAEKKHNMATLRCDVSFLGFLLIIGSLSVELVFYLCNQFFKIEG